MNGGIILFFAIFFVYLLLGSHRIGLILLWASLLGSLGYIFFKTPNAVFVGVTVGVLLVLGYNFRTVAVESAS